MKHYHSRSDPQLAAEIKAGAIGIIKTDTLYGIIASAYSKDAVRRLYHVRGRDPEKACILLIATIDHIFDLPHDTFYKVFTNYWPGPVSIVLPAAEKTPTWVPRLNETIAYRIPDDSELVDLLKQTGPLLAPSANPQGLLPANNIDDAQAYFGASVDFYVDGGSVAKNISPSRIVRLDAFGREERLR